MTVLLTFIGGIVFTYLVGRGIVATYEDVIKLKTKEKTDAN